MACDVDFPFLLCEIALQFIAQWLERRPLDNRNSTSGAT
jgi:hypothetical protein